ncbi:MAG: insulinase family protein [Deltaproteobacteria bacterium]|nr:insulinase family protein [Deltaproteobacteria bacterium]
MKRVLSTVAVVLLMLSSCEPKPAPPPASPPVPPPTVSAAPVASPSVAPDAFREKAPAGAPMPDFVPPTIVEHKLANGLRVLLVERHELPIVAFQIVVDRGADQGPPGTGAFLGAMLVQGSKTRSALEISDALGKLGAQFGSWGSLDSLGVHGKVLAPSFSEAFAILAECVRDPAFAKDEVERERSKRLTMLAQQKDSPAILLRNAVSEVLYPDNHPYHAPLLGNEQALKKLGAKELAAFHRSQVDPDDVTVAIAGDVTKEAALAQIEKAFGDWKGKKPKASDVADPPGMEGAPRVIVIDRPGATQSHLAATLLGVPRSSKDFHALMVMNTILGGQFSSRLNLNLREKHAYTYGASSSFDMRHGAGPFTAGGAIVREKTEPAAQEILAEIKRIIDAEVSEEELADAKTNLIRRLPASFETVSDVAGSIAYLAIYGLPLDEYHGRAAAYRAVTRADVQRVAKRYLSPDKLRLVIVGDADVIVKDLDKMGLGKIEVRRAAAKK